MNINKTQRFIIIIVAFFVIGMLLYPPFQMVNNGAERNAGYSFITSPPTKYATVNTSMLITQWIAVLLVGILLFFLNNSNSVKIQKKDNFVFSEQNTYTKSKNNNHSDDINFNYKRIILILLTIILASFFAFIGRTHGKHFADKYIKNVIHNYNYSRNLSIKNLDSLQLSTLSFNEFTEATYPISDELKNKFIMFKNMECRSEYIDIVCSQIISTPNWKFNIDGAVNSIIDSVLNLDGVSNGLHFKKNIKKFDMDGIYFEIEYSKDNIQRKIIGMVLGKGEKTWQVSIIFHKYFNNIADKIFNSLIIHNTTPNTNTN